MAAANPNWKLDMEKDLKNEPLKKCFASIVEANQVTIGLQELQVILCDHLKIDLDILEPGLVKVLPYFLAYQVKHWLGWEWRLAYHKGKLSFEAWYEAFFVFLGQRLEQALEMYREVMREIRNEQVQKSYENKSIVDQSTQVSQFLAKVEAPFTIEIIGKPAMLNTIVFDDHKNDVVLKPHLTVEWLQSDLESFSITQILNWPHIGIHMYSPILSFSRKNCQEYQRYVSTVANLFPNKKTDDFIKHIDILNANHTRTCYTIAYIRKVTSDIVDLLEGLYVSPSVINLFQSLFEELLLDIEELQVLRDGSPTIASNTSLLFTIGKCTYFRNKKWSKGGLTSLQDIVYFESIIPRMEIDIIEVGNEDQIKCYIDQVKKLRTSSNIKVKLPLITFSCLFCQVHIQSIDLVVKHFKGLHKMEPPMMCSICKKTFSVLDLTRHRWKHDCKEVIEKATKGGSGK